MKSKAKDARIRVGIVGAGDNTRSRHIPGLLAMPGVEIVGVCNRRRESSEAVAKQFSIPQVYDRWEDVVAAADTDAIVIGTWPYLHAPVTIAALQAGKHVLCEARMAMNLEEAQAMLAAAQAQPECVAQIVPAPFTLHVDKAVRRLVDEGFIGKLLSVQVQANGGAFLDHEGELTWRRDVNLSGGNIMSMGIWYEILMRWIGEASNVMALGKVVVPKRRDVATGRMRDVLVPEHLDILATMRDGAQAHLQFSSVHGLVPANEASLFGTEGTLRFVDNLLLGGRRGDRTLRHIRVRPDEAGEWRVEEEFINAIRGKENVKLTDFASAVRYMAFTEAVNQSLREGRMVAVPK